MTELENTREKQVITPPPRDEKGRLLPGQSLNPAGKPAGTKHLSTKLWDALQKVALDEDGHPREDQKTYADLLVQRVMSDAIKKGNTQLIQLAWDRIDGKPEQGINMNVTDTREATTADVMEIAQKVAEELKKKKTG